MLIDIRLPLGLRPSVIDLTTCHESSGFPRKGGWFGDRVHVGRTKTDDTIARSTHGWSAQHEG